MTIHRPQAVSLFDRLLLTRAVIDAVKKLDPRQLIRNPVIFTTALVAALCTVISIEDAMRHSSSLWLMAQLTAWLWFTVLFANLAEAVAEGRGKAQAESLKRTKSDTMAKKLADPNSTSPQLIRAEELKADDLVICETGDTIPGDGDVVAGIATRR